MKGEPQLEPKNNEPKEVAGSQHFNIEGQLITLDFAISAERDEIDYKISSDGHMRPVQIAFILHLVAKKMCIDNNIDVSSFLLDLQPDKNTH